MINNSKVNIKVLDMVDKGILAYTAFWDPHASIICSAFWRFTYSYRVTAERMDNDAQIVTEITLFHARGITRLND